RELHLHEPDALGRELRGDGRRARRPLVVRAVREDHRAPWDVNADEKRGATSRAKRSAQRRCTSRGVPGTTVCGMMWLKPASTNHWTRSATVSGDPISWPSVHGTMLSGSVRTFQRSNVAAHAS